MLDSETKESILWKKHKGWGSTKKGRAVFEELYRSFQKITVNSVLQYGHLIPQSESDSNFEEVKRLDATNDTWYFQESSYKKIPVIKKYTDFNLKAISPNCDESFVILDKNGEQIKNIIPFDFSLTGLYNYELKTSEGAVIDWGVCDWEVDVDSSLLTFNNGVPEGINADNPPTLTFYQYIGPTGERHYLDAVLLNGKVSFEKGSPFVNCLNSLKDSLAEIHPDFYKNNGFNGSDLTEGIGLQFNKYYEVTGSNTGDVLKGYDDNSHSNVVSLMTHLTSNKKEKILFVSEGHQKNKVYTVEVTPTSEEEPFVKIYTEDGFIVVKNEKAIFTFAVEETEECTISLWVKDNETSELELFYPRKNEELNFKIPTFVDLIQLPPHLKLDIGTSGLTDQITPDYYGPRTKDFVVAVCDEENPEKSSTDWRSSDFVIYNKENFRLSDALSMKGKLPHVYFRNGTYIQDSFVVDEDTLHLEGESVVRTVFETESLRIEGADNLIENISFKNSVITVNGDTVFNNVGLEESCTLIIKEGVNVVIKHSNITTIENSGNLEIFESTINSLSIKEEGQSSLYDSNVIDSISNTKGKLSLYGSYCKTLEDNEGTFFVNGSHIHTLSSKGSTEDSIVATSNITKVEALPEYIKIDSSYVTEFGESIKRNVYPNEATIPYYSSFNKRVYAKLPDPFSYDEEKNTIEIKLDTINHTIFLNEKGELQCRLFSFEEVLVDDPEAIKTQIEEVYKEHADTLLDKNKPSNLKEAIVDLYWSKADLKGGKVPIDQLPDSVAYGGLSFVGMWSFEKNEGSYPTFEDIDTSSMSDDNYTDLQRGWFFIVEASTKDDDPCFPQTAVDEVEFTAGDWIVYEGKDKEGNNKWSKVDRAYLDPVYSRLPEMAPVTDDVNLQWSVKDGGTGLLQLSYKTLAEALRLINEQLLKLSPDRSIVIQQTSLVFDEATTDAEKREVFRVSDGLQLKQVILCNNPEIVYESKNSKVGFKLDTSAELPLNRFFYCGKESEIKALDNKEEVDCEIDRFDPYERFRLGFRLPSGITSAYVEGTTTLGDLETSRKIHNVEVAQYNVINDDIINEDSSKFEGATEPLSFVEQKIYRLEDVEFVRSKDSDSNFLVLRDLATKHTTGGYRYLPLGTQVTTFFTVKNFAKWGAVDKDAKIEVVAKLGDVELETEITSQSLRINNEDLEQYDLVVNVEVTLPSEKPYYHGDLTINAVATNVEVKEGIVFSLPSVSVIDPSKVKDVVESATVVLYPTLDMKGGEDRKTHFGSKLQNVEEDTGLPYGPKGFGWPLEIAYLSNFTLDPGNTRPSTKDGLKMGDSTWRFVTFKKSFESIQDICGFGIKFDWTDKEPAVNKSTGVLEDVMVQVCVTSDEEPHIELQNANKVVPVFFKAEFTRDEAVNFTGTSDASYRRVTFGRKPVPVKDIFIRVGLKEGSDLYFDSIEIED